MLHAKLRNRTCQGLDRQGQGQGPIPTRIRTRTRLARTRTSIWSLRTRTRINITVFSSIRTAVAPSLSLDQRRGTCSKTINVSRTCKLTVFVVHWRRFFLNRTRHTERIRGVIFCDINWHLQDRGSCKNFVSNSINNNDYNAWGLSAANWRMFALYRMRS